MYEDQYQKKEEKTGIKKLLRYIRKNTMNIYTHSIVLYTTYKTQN